MKLSRPALDLSAGLLLLPVFLGMLVLHVNRRVMAQERNSHAGGKIYGKKVVMSTDSEEPAHELLENSDLAGQLKLAIDANDLEEVKRLMVRHPELHCAPLGYGKNGPLTWVAECRVSRVPPNETRLAMARWMIENGSDVHQGGDGPLMRTALDDSKLPMTELLVAHGADVNAQRRSHRTDVNRWFSPRLISVPKSSVTGARASSGRARQHLPRSGLVQRGLFPPNCKPTVACSP